MATSGKAAPSAAPSSIPADLKLTSVLQASGPVGLQVASLSDLKSADTEQDLSAVEKVAKSFEIFRDCIRTDQAQTLGNTFHNSNDFYSLAEILSEGPDVSPDSKGFVNVVIAESDIFSALHKLEGDVIICDVDRELLDYLNEFKDYLLRLYALYKNKSLGFVDIEKGIKLFCSATTHGGKDFAARRGDVGCFHFLFDEENYQRAMEALTQKKIVTMDINLFDPEEQKLFCEALGDFSLKIKLFNATNLPDYDHRDMLLKLFKSLPWAENFQLIWNIHDRGPLYSEEPQNIDRYTHYFFVVSSVAEYARHREDRPLLLAEADSLVLPFIAEYFPKHQIPAELHKRYSCSDECKDANCVSKIKRNSYFGRLAELSKQPRMNSTLLHQKYSMCYVPRNWDTMRYLCLYESWVKGEYEKNLQRNKTKKNEFRKFYLECLCMMRKVDLFDLMIKEGPTNLISDRTQSIIRSSLSSIGYQFFDRLKDPITSTSLVMSTLQVGAGMSPVQSQRAAVVPDEKEKPAEKQKPVENPPKKQEVNSPQRVLNA